MQENYTLKRIQKMARRANTTGIKKLQQASEQMDMQPIREYENKIRTSNKSEPPHKNKMGHTDNKTEEQHRWQGWISEKSYIHPERAQPTITNHGNRMGK